MFSQLAKRSARFLPADLCTDHAHYVKNHRSTVLRKNKNMAVEGGTVSHYYILVICKFIDFMSLFRLGNITETRPVHGKLDHHVSAGRKRDGFKQLHVSVEFTKYGNTLFRPVFSTDSRAFTPTRKVLESKTSSLFTN